MGIGIPGCWADYGKVFNMDKINKRRWSIYYEVLFIDEVCDRMHRSRSATYIPID